MEATSTHPAAPPAAHHSARSKAPSAQAFRQPRAPHEANPHRPADDRLSPVSPPHGPQRPQSPSPPPRSQSAERDPSQCASAQPQQTPQPRERPRHALATSTPTESAAAPSTPQRSVIYSHAQTLPPLLPSLKPSYDLCCETLTEKTYSIKDAERSAIV